MIVNEKFNGCILSFTASYGVLSIVVNVKLNLNLFSLIFNSVAIVSLFSNLSS